ncbi:hypothetical protein GCM10009865_05780 [Aeromicrobium ponti]|uniref:Uncharacterized protein DUF3221 n=1 Tax=Cytobacillus oceanisediminis TaxID=665099 RepID=A0A562K6G8_9BACI|nr:DUF3221 domain-containing protein [Cytobacillus oceanisediminis]TWH91031.1 uncharacterized protein DUF3221 [Cytobacillus oceanisediminis]
MHTKLLVFALSIPILFLGACSTDNQTTKVKETIQTNADSSDEQNNEQSVKISSEEGYIVRIFDSGKIWVIPEITKSEIAGKSEEEINKILNDKYEGKGFHFSVEDIDKEVLAALKVGQKVSVKFDIYGHSAPMNAHATEIKIIEE